MQGEVDMSWWWLLVGLWVVLFLVDDYVYEYYDDGYDDYYDDGMGLF